MFLCVLKEEPCVYDEHGHTIRLVGVKVHDSVVDSYLVTLYKANDII